MKTQTPEINLGTVVGVVSKVMETIVTLRNAGESAQLSITHAKIVAELVTMRDYVDTLGQDNTEPQPSTCNMEITHLTLRY